MKRYRDSFLYFASGGHVYMFKKRSTIILFCIFYLNFLKFIPIPIRRTVSYSASMTLSKCYPS